ncbi:uncharacterized protein LOC107610996 [Arachis ipaensis]|uniref:Reverse transcriptase zinc-binding domain-containing protein n=1 Tax=Arachis hypogaea TaxID=3818 RepID=A0A445B074_ARAHY|nr:uncharacterized protein LOC107610996 [Arachis ipaensis]RYR32082.1 hypothetical protein Ahy_B01g057077 [Arachis hypogaea]
MSKPDSLVARILKARYYNRKRFIEAEKGNNPNFTWKSIWGAKEVLDLGGLWKVGTGRNIKIWEDTWLPNQNGFKVWSPRTCFEQEATVDNLINQEENTWKQTLILQIFLPFKANQILALPIDMQRQDDRFYWKFSKKGEYEVKTTYHIIRAHNRSQQLGTCPKNQEKEKWKQLWKMKIPPRSLNFMWRLMHNSLSKKTNIQRRGINCDLICSRYSMSREESEAHLFRDCDWESRFLFVSPFNLQTKAAAGMPLLKWVSTILNQIENERKGLFICCLHGLWHSRNKLLFENENLHRKQFWREQPSLLQKLCVQQIHHHRFKSHLQTVKV